MFVKAVVDGDELSHHVVLLDDEEAQLAREGRSRIVDAGYGDDAPGLALISICYGHDNTSKIDPVLVLPQQALRGSRSILLTYPLMTPHLSLYRGG